MWLLIVVVVVALIGYYLWQNGFNFYGKRDYQAIFLSNGQVYFGKASGFQSSFINLRDVYYLQVQQVLQPVQGQRDPQPVQQISLAKLGIAELHKPKDLMRINKDHVLFIEDLDEDSQVVTAIRSYQESLKKSGDAMEK